MRGQTLPWVAINIVGMIVLMIILISIITLQKNVSMTAKELNLRSATMMMLREFITSPNCVSYETYSYYYLNGTKPRVLFYVVNHPGIVDVNKYSDFYHFNCIRYDSKYKRSEISYAYKAKLVDAEEKSSKELPIWDGMTTNHKIINFGVKRDDSYFPPNGSTYAYEVSPNYWNFPETNETLQMIQPILIANGSTLHLGVLYFKVIVDKSKNFEGQVKIWGGSLS